MILRRYEGIGVLAFAMLGLALAQLRGIRPRLMTAFFVAMLCMLAVLSRMFTPLLLGPALAATYMATIPFNPIVRRGRTFLLVTVLALVSVFGVWFAELAGWVSTTTSWRDGQLVLTSPIDGIESFPALPVIAVSMGLLVVIGSAFSYFALRHMRETRKQVLVQAWHLRQLTAPR